MRCSESLWSLASDSRLWVLSLGFDLGLSLELMGVVHQINIGKNPSQYWVLDPDHMREGN